MSPSRRRSSRPPRSAPPPLQRLAFWCAGTAAVVFVLWLLGSVLLLVFAAVLLAVILRSTAARLAHAVGWPVGAGLAAVSALVVVVLLGAGFALGPSLVEQSDQLWDRLSDAIEKALQWLQQSSWGRAIVQGASPESVDGTQLANRVGIALMSVVGAAASLVIVVVSAVYFAAAPKFYLSGLVRLLPPRHRRRGRAFLAAATATLRNWLYGQGIGMLIIAITSYIGLAIIGVPLAPLLALIAGLTDFVPYVGPVIGAAAALLVALGEGWNTALWVGVLFAGLQLIQGNVIEPLIQRHTTRLPPALTILSQTVLGTLFGALGVALATPLLAVVLVGVRMLYVESLLEGRELHAPESA